MKQIPNIEEEKGMELILEVLPHLILGNAEELYNNPDGEMAKNTISEMQRVIRETHHQQLQKAREEERKQTLREIDIGDNDYITVRRAVAELSGIPMMAITFDEHIKVIKEKLNHSELDQDKV